MKTILRDVFRWLALGAVALAVFYVGLMLFGSWHDEWSGYNASVSVSDGYCNIAVIPLHGEMTTAALFDEYGTPIPSASLDDFMYALRSAEYDPNIEGVIVSIDSPGGSPYAGEAVANELMRSPLASAAVIRDQGLSAGYWAATGADRIFASPVSDVGSIGATMSYLEYAKQNEESGLRYVEIASGPLKNAGDPDRHLSDDELARFQSDIDALADVFIREVAKNRNMPLDAVEAIADGGSYLGASALEKGLVDELGDRENARLWFSSALSLNPEDVVLCE